MYYHTHLLKKHATGDPPPAATGGTFIYSVSVASGDTISVPMINNDDTLYDFTVNFGDGSGDKSVTAYADTDREHTYTSTSQFDITITGQFE